MSKKKKLFTLFLALTVVFTMCFAAVPAYAASGTAITNADELKAMSANGNYYLANDIEVPANLILFTSYDAPFTGTLDGNKVITVVYTKDTVDPIKPDPVKPEPTKPADTPNTGDSSHMFLWLGLAVISGGAVIGVVIANKKKNHNR